MARLRRRLRFNNRTLASNEVVCQICGRVFSTRLNYTHLRKHGLTMREYSSSYPGALIYSRDFSKKISRLSSARMKKRWEKDEWRDYMHPIQVESGKKVSKILFSAPEYEDFRRAWKVSSHTNFSKEEWEDPEYREWMKEVCSKGGSAAFNYLWHSKDKNAVEFRERRRVYSSNRMWEIARSNEPYAIAIREKRGDWRYLKGYFYSEKNSCSYFYRSSYERRALELIEKDSTVVKYCMEPFCIPYFTGVKRNYTPDILVHYKDGKVKLIEVKPETFVEPDDPKYIAAQHYCERRGYTFEFWTEETLFRGGY